jgi:glycosyltransferase involved in cell wall biosynthesis
VNRLKKRIVIDATPLLYTENGIGRVTRSLITELRNIDSSFDIHIFGRRLQGQRLDRYFPDLPTTHLRLPRSTEKAIRSCRLIELLCRGDLYHATDFYLPLANPAKCIATIHDIIFLNQPEKMVDHQRLKEWVPEFARKCRRLIAVSEFSKQDIIRVLDIAPEKIDVVYWGVDSKTFFPEPDSKDIRALTTSLTGTNNPFFLAVSCSPGRKNTPLLLEAFSEFLRNKPSHDLVLVWTPPDEIRARVASGKNSERIHFTGRVNDQSLRYLYNRATAVLYPSLYEGFGLPVLEAMSCGTPVITSNNSSLPEVGGDAAIYVDPLDKTSIIHALEFFENRPHLAKELYDRCIGQAAKFTWERCARETLAVYRRCLES